MKIRFAEMLKIGEKVIRRKGINVGNHFYRCIRLNCIDREDYHCKKAKRFRLNDTNQNVWIPNKHLEDDGTIKVGENIDYTLLKRWRQCAIAGVDLSCIQGSKGWNFRKIKTK